MTMISPGQPASTQRDPSDAWLTGTATGAGTPLSEQVYRLVRLAIVTGRLMPGAALQETSITEHLGISRTPVREALLRLKEDGLILIKRQSGTFVAPVDADRVEEGIIVRESLEPRIAEIAAGRIDGQTLRQLTELTDRMAHAAAGQDSRAFIEADDQFHQVLIDASGHLHIASIIQKINAQLDRIRYLSVAEPLRAQVAIDEHRQLLAALSERDSDACGSLLRKHLAGSWVLIRKYLKALAPQTADAGADRKQTP